MWRTARGRGWQRMLGIYAGGMVLAFAGGLGFDAVETRWYLRCLHDDPATPRDLVDLARELRVPEDVRRPLVEPEAKAAMRRIIACFLAASFA